MKAKWTLPGKLPALLERYQYPLLILLAGLALLLWPGGGSKSQSAAPALSETQAPQLQEEDEAQRYRERTERELESILSQVQGAGKVRVMLSLKRGSAAQYQTDRSTQRRSGDSGTEEQTEEKTVMTQRGSAYTEPALVSRAYPVFQGALILSQGASDPAVRLALSGAVGALLGLGADQITVVTMK